MSLTPSRGPVVRSWAVETARAFIQRHLWGLLTMLATAAGVVVGWMFGGTVTPEPPTPRGTDDIKPDPPANY